MATGGKKIKIVLRRCTPPASRDKFSEKFSASTVFSKEKVGLKKKMNIEIANEGILVSRIAGT